MGKETGVDWTKSTNNDWVVCTEKSEACTFCYSKTLVVGRMGYDWGRDAVRIRSAETNRKQLHRWNAEAARTGAVWPVFHFSLADWADPWIDTRSDERIAADQLAAEAKARARGLSDKAVQRQRDLFARVDLNVWRREWFERLDATPALTHLMLTKRAERLGQLLPGHWLSDWPQNCWIGLTTETQEWAALRLVFALDVVRRTLGQAKVFISAEPLYGRIDLTALPILEHETVTRMLRAEYPRYTAERFADQYQELVNRHAIGETWDALAGGVVRWVITGGQSAGSPKRWLVDPATGALKPDARAWLTTIRDQCIAAKVPFFHKQHGGRTPKANGKDLDGRAWCETPW